MSDLLHDSHLCFNFLIEYAILHKSAFFKFLGGKWNAIKLLRDLVYGCEGTLSNDTHSVVLRATFPFSWLSTGNVRLCSLRRSNIFQGIRKEIYLNFVNPMFQIRLMGYSQVRPPPPPLRLSHEPFSLRQLQSGARRSRQDFGHM